MPQYKHNTSLHFSTWPSLFFTGSVQTPPRSPASTPVRWRCSGYSSQVEGVFSDRGKHNVGIHVHVQTGTSVSNVFDFFLSEVLQGVRFVILLHCRLLLIGCGRTCFFLLLQLGYLVFLRLFLFHISGNLTQYQRSKSHLHSFLKGREGKWNESHIAFIMA